MVFMGALELKQSEGFCFYFCRLVTPYSKLGIKVLNKNTLRSDTVLGQCSVDLFKELTNANGKCKYDPLSNKSVLDCSLVEAQSFSSQNAKRIILVSVKLYCHVDLSLS